MFSKPIYPTFFVLCLSLAVDNCTWQSFTVIFGLTVSNFLYMQHYSAVSELEYVILIIVAGWYLFCAESVTCNACSWCICCFIWQYAHIQWLQDSSISSV